MISKLSQYFFKLRESSLLGFIILFLIVLRITSPSFLSLSNLSDVFANIATLGIVAIGETMVIIGRGIDLSVGAVLGLSALVSGSLALHGSPMIVVLAVGILLGIIAGGINGLFIGVFKIPAIIVTLATLGIYSGLMYMVTNGAWVQNLPSSMKVFGGTKLGIPLPLLYLVLVVVVFWFVLTQTKFGRYIYAVGNNAAAARMSGIRSSRVEFGTYTLSGLLAGFAGVIYVSYFGFATTTTGTDLELQAVAAAVIGGTLVSGGRGSVVGTLLGTILTGLISSALIFYHLPSLWNQTVQGLIILLAVIGDANFLRLSIGRSKI